MGRRLRPAMPQGPRQGRRPTAWVVHWRARPQESAGWAVLAARVSAALGRGAAIGALAVPPSWDAIAPTTSPIAPLLGGAPISAPPAAVPGMPGMPAASAAGYSFNGNAPKYGFRPTVIVPSPAAG